MNKIMKNTLSLFAITGVAGLLLGLVYEGTLQTRKDQEIKTQQNAYKTVFKDASEFEDVDLKNIVLNESGTDQEAAIVNVEELIHSYINYAMQNDGSEKDTVDISPYYQEHYQVEADENRVFVIREFYIGYNKSTETIEDLFLSGYLLSRENE